MSEPQEIQKRKRNPRVLFKLRDRKIKKNFGMRPPGPWPVRLSPAQLQLQLQENPKFAAARDCVKLAHELTKREIEVLHHLCNGESAKETAQVFGISYRTVENHWENIRHKTGATNCVTIALWAVKNKIVKL